MTRRILHVVNYGWPFVDGYTIRTAGLATAQARDLAVDVRVVTSPFEPFAQATDPRFTTAAWGPHVQVDLPGSPASWERPGIGLAPRTTRRMAAALDDVIATWQPDVVHAHHPHYVGSAAHRAARRAGLPFVYEVRCFNGDYDLDRRHPWARLRGRRFNQAEAALARLADVVVTISDGLARRLHAVGVAPERVRVVRNSVDTSRFRPAPPPGPGGPLRIGYATTFEAIENLDLLVEATRLAYERGAEVTTIVAGTGRDWDRIAALVAQHGLDDVVVLPGFVPYADMPDFYHDLDLFVVPRGDATVARDTTPLKPLEALASGIPVWATDLPAMRELFADRDDVTLLPPEPGTLATMLEGAATDRPRRADGDVGDRGWAREVHRYEGVYDLAQRVDAGRRTPA